jgi:dsRNA-specific ribonuclease
MMSNDKMDVPMYKGIRGQSFKNLITTILKRGKVSQQIIDTLLDEEGMKLYEVAFTHPSTDSEENYEYLEFLGDSVVNTAIVWYIARRFKQLQGSKGVKVMARLKINLISKKSFAECAQRLNIWDYISCSETIRQTNKRKVLEDVFEAFFGATTFLMDNKVFHCSGYAVVYAIVASLFDEISISLKYEDLFDARTRIKELFDCNKDIGTLEYDTIKDSNNVFTSKAHLVKHDSTRVYLGVGTGNTKVDSIQIASQQAIYSLKIMGVQLAIKPEYEDL